MEIVATTYVALIFLIQFHYKKTKSRFVLHEIISGVLTYLFFSYVTMLIIADEKLFLSYPFWPTLDFLKALLLWPTYISLVLNFFGVFLLFLGEIKKERKLNCVRFYIGSAVLAISSLVISIGARIL